MSRFVDLDQFKAYIEHNLDGVDDAELQECLDVAEEQLLGTVHRTFDVADGTGDPVTRYYGIDDPWTIRIDDLARDTDLSISITVDATPETIPSTAWQLQPLNRRDGWPYTSIRRVDGYRWDRNLWGKASLAVTSSWWGWSAVPSTVPQVVKMLARNLWGYRRTQFGAQVVGDFTVMIGGDRMAEALIQTLTRGKVLQPRMIELDYAGRQPTTIDPWEVGW